MATSSVFTTTPVARLTYTTNASQIFNKRNINFSVKCMSQAPENPQANSSTEPSKMPATPINSTPPPKMSTPPPPPPPKAPKVSTKFNDLLAFSGPAPERINGRLAMIGFVSVLAVELSSGQDMLSQVSNGGLVVFVGTSVVLTLASLIPLFKGIRAESKYTRGVMSSDVELLNGRVAMLGLVALALTEYVKGSALV